MYLSRFLSLALVLLALVAPFAVHAQTEDAPKLETAIFAGGCFWCVEEAFEKVKGVEEVVSGYTGGDLESPTYEQVGTQETGHYEAVRVRYDPTEVSYDKLLDTFWHNVDPFDAKGQFCDKGYSYLAAIFVTEEQRAAAEKSKSAVAHSLNKPVVTEILPVEPFYLAEDYHQGYYEKNPVRYKYYKWACGRAQRLEEIWGPPESS